MVGVVDEGIGLANSARMYDYLLGGAQNFAVDREAVHAALARFPHLARSVAVLQADLTDPATVLASAEVADTLDLTAPVAVLVLSVLHFVPDTANPAGAIATYLDALAPGSALALSHISDDQPTEAEPEKTGPGVRSSRTRSTKA